MFIFEDQPVAEATIDDIDLESVADYCMKIGYTRGDAAYYLRHNKRFIVDDDGEERIR